jgi:hypothetical protein
MSCQAGLGRSKLGRPAGIGPTTGDAVGLQVERPRETDRRDDDQERRRQPRHDEAEPEQDRERDRADDERGAADAPELLRYLRELRQRLTRVDRQTEQLRQLTNDEDDGDAVDVADEHRAREVVGDPAEAEHPGERKAQPDEQGQHRRQLGRVCTAGDRQGQDCRADESGDRAFGPDDELPRRTEQHVGDGRQEQGVEAVHGARLPPPPRTPSPRGLPAPPPSCPPRGLGGRWELGTRTAALRPESSA